MLRVSCFGLLYLSDSDHYAVSTRRKFTFAPNVTPISYPSDRPRYSSSDPNSPSSEFPSTDPQDSSESTDSKPTRNDVEHDSNTYNSSPRPESLASSVPTAIPSLEPPSMSSAALPSAIAPSLMHHSHARPRRRGHRRDSAEHIPRPPNAFMLFRQNFVHQRHVPGSIETNHNSLSKIVGASSHL